MAREQMATTDEYLPVATFQRRAGVGPCTMWRWIRRGVRGGITLRTVVIGGRRYTTQAWWDEFVAACSAPTGPTAEQLATPTERRRAYEQAEADLDAAGL